MISDALLIIRRRKLDLLSFAIQSDQLSKAIAKMMPMRLGKVIERMLVEIEAAVVNGNVIEVVSRDARALCRRA